MRARAEEGRVLPRDTHRTGSFSAIARTSLPPPRSTPRRVCTSTGWQVSDPRTDTRTDTSGQTAAQLHRRTFIRSGRRPTDRLFVHRRKIALSHKSSGPSGGKSTNTTERTGRSIFAARWPEDRTRFSQNTICTPRMACAASNRFAISGCGRETA